MLNQADKLSLVLVQMNGNDVKGQLEIRQPFAPKPTCAVTRMNLDLNEPLSQGEAPCA